MGKFNPVKAITALFSCITLFFAAFGAFESTATDNIARQNAHMNYLADEFYTDYTPVSESTLAGFDIQQAVADGVKYNEVSFIGTHNSYQADSTAEYKALYAALSEGTFGLVNAADADFRMDHLTDQLELGVRTVEIDVETIVKNGRTQFIVCHSPLTNVSSNCYDFAAALREIKMWSDNNPNHLPISVVIEPKKMLPPIHGLKNFSLKYANEFDALLREILGETLLTPAEMMGDFASLKDMREADGWLPLGDTLGKVLVLLHDTTVTSDYINQDQTIKTQAMFPMLRYADRYASYASFVLDNTPSDALKHKAESIDKCHLIVRTRADSFNHFSDSEYSDAIRSGAQIISSDYPPATFENDHVFTFDNGSLVRLNAAK